MIKSIGFIGSGNVAGNISVKLLKQRFDIKFLYSKTKKNQKRLATKLNCLTLDSLDDIPLVDLIFICVNDDQIESVSNKLAIQNNTIVIHCSGSVNREILKKNKNNGVFYPFQSFNKNEEVNWGNIPILVEASNEENEKKLTQLAQRLSSKVEIADSNQRRVLHLSGVLINNFTNHLAVLSKEILVQNNLNPNLLNSLTRQTADNILSGNPELFQTGPAVRLDLNTINSHLELLKENENLKIIYRQLTQSIQLWNAKKDL